jgi:hypothetical protein
MRAHPPTRVRLTERDLGVRVQEIPFGLETGRPDDPNMKFETLKSYMGDA